ncbi:hypothetical protein NLG97_g10614 [Lecanicillium saksenae]|uniref:Uncharacterized protein n=1 Tax=Lecanicillium saksenae TaxID=468837 RepID=A0ACC1QCW1_9HYPO|nr:hypothetical protein NLG97_g10614 [Lecanicillium saksenae]
MNRWTVHSGGFTASAPADDASSASAASAAAALVAESSQDGIATLDAPAPFRDFSMRAEITMLWEDGHAGFLLRASDVRPGGRGGASFGGYEASINAQGWVGLSIDDWPGLCWKCVQMELPPHQAHTLMVRAKNGLIQVFVNDMINPKLSGKDQAHIEGLVGVRFENTGATFENLQISPI